MQRAMMRSIKIGRPFKSHRCKFNERWITCGDAFIRVINVAAIFTFATMLPKRTRRTLRAVDQP